MRLDVAAPLLLAPLAAAHGAVTSYIIGGKTYQGYDGFAPANTPEVIQFPWPGTKLFVVTSRYSRGTNAILIRL